MAMQGLAVTGLTSRTHDGDGQNGQRYVAGDQRSRTPEWLPMPAGRPVRVTDVGRNS